MMSNNETDIIKDYLIKKYSIKCQKSDEGKKVVIDRKGCLSNVWKQIWAFHWNCKECVKHKRLNDGKYRDT